MKRLALLLLAFVIFTPSAHASWDYITGAELDSVTQGVEISGITTPFTLSTTAHSGTYSYEVTGGNGFGRPQIFSSNNTATGTLRAWVYVKSYPTGNTRLLYLATIANVFQGAITMTTTGQLSLAAAGGASIGSLSTAVPLNTWTCVEVQVEPTTGATGTITGRLNGSSFASGAANSTTGWGRAVFGAPTGTQTTTDILFDDVAITDGTTGYPGCGSTKFLHPNAAGDSNQWLQPAAAAGTNNYTFVNETPPDDLATYVRANTTPATDLYNFDNSGLQSYDTVNALLTGVRFSSSGTATNGTFKIAWEGASAGTIAYTSQISVANTTWRTNGISLDTYVLATSTDAVGSALTNSVLDSMQQGVYLDTTPVNFVYISNLWSYIDYTPGTPPPPAGGGDSGVVIFD
jgi:hypothetical protein